MTPERYIVTTRIEGKDRSVIWDSSAPLELGHPARWRLENQAQGLRVLPLAQGGRAFPVGTGDGIVLGEARPGQALTLTLKRARSLAPAWRPSESRTSGLLHYSRGVGIGLASFEAFGRRLLARAEGSRIFVLKRKRDGSFRLKVLSNDICLKRGEDEPRLLKRREVLSLNQHELLLTSILWRKNWWRWNLVPVATVPEPALPVAASESEAEAQEFFRVMGKSLLGFLGFALLVLILPRLFRFKEDPPPPAPITVALKQPKQVMLQSRPRPVEARPAAPPPKTAEPAPKKASPKTASPVTAAPRSAPEKPAPAPVEKSAGPSPEQLKAAAAAKNKAALAKSLGFLSTASNSAVVIPEHSGKTRYQAPSADLGKPAQGSQVLNTLSKTRAPDGPIETKGSRSMDASVAIRGGSFGDVQAKVDAGAISGKVRASDFSAMLSAKGMSVSGDGEVEDSEIEKALSKHLARFQYCYEKALLSNSALSGLVVAQWTIGAGGSASDVKIVKSQLNQPGLHQCLSQEIKQVRFPAPSGGSVIVKYPFSFSSTTM